MRPPTRLGRAPITSTQSTATQRGGAGCCKRGAGQPRARLPAPASFPPHSTVPNSPSPPNRSSHRGVRGPVLPPAQALPLPRASPTAHGQVCASYPPPDRRKRQRALPTVPQQPYPEQGWGSSWQLTVPSPPMSARFIDEKVVALGAEALPCGHSPVGVGQAASSA